MKGARMTLQDIKASKVARINEHVLIDAQKLNKKKPNLLPNQPAPQVMWMHGQLAYWGIKEGINVVKEHRFHETRRWRFDLALPDLKIAVEFEGVFSDKSRHTNKIGYSKDTDKYREAAKNGWVVLRYTTVNYKNLMQDVKELYDRMAPS